MKKGKILVIDDEEKLRQLLTKLIVYEGFEVIQSGDCKTALKKMLEHDIDLVICDVKLPDGNGVELSVQIKKQYPLTEIILLTAYGNIPDGVQAIKNGAFDYITKGDDNNKIIPLLYRAVEKAELAKRVKHLEKQLASKFSFDSIIGTSKKIQSAVHLAKSVAQTDATVLLMGETGTGKEVFAQAIHYGSNRNFKNFVAINCSAISGDILESEMFGHKAGAFTGAVKDQKGLFEEANNGTIFLDEIGEMSFDLQAKLLRVLEAGEFIKVGETRPTKVNVRVIAATNRKLEECIKQKLFREDLYYRLAGFQINIPPLRERPADIELFAKHFVEMFSAKTNKKIKTIADSYLQALILHNWPGNIRELKNVIERSIILATTDELTIDTLPHEFLERKHTLATSQGSSFDLASVEKTHIQKILNYTNGNKTETARLLNIGLTTLYRKIAEYNI
ncbi:MAG: sigma-54-dependent Fis family transcriptional regulator [Chloroflexia bacterium]|nr:sigma-54-dependent Fis family transcriptional regulator [Chloroflexia bacterium]